jgi:hypothetical protein
LVGYYPVTVGEGVRSHQRELFFKLKTKIMYEVGECIAVDAPAPVEEQYFIF